MAQEYRKFYLSPGQQAPEGSTGIGMSDGSIIWEGEEGTFPKEATLGHRLPTDPEFATTYVNHVMSQAELDEYNRMLEYQRLPSGLAALISFDDFKNGATSDAKKAAIKTIIDNI